MMVLNDQILDVIRNRKYSLKPTPVRRDDEVDGRKSASGDDNIIAKILERRLRMAYQTEDEEDETDRASDCTSVQVIYQVIR
jgi:hypothetical protein